jgi:hypothetical protein
VKVPEVAPIKLEFQEVDKSIFAQPRKEQTSSFMADILDAKQSIPSSTVASAKRKVYSPTESPSLVATTPSSKKSKVHTEDSSPQKSNRKRSPTKKSRSPKKKKDDTESLSSPTSDEIDSDSYLCTQVKGKEINGDAVRTANMLNKEMYDYMLYIFKRQKKVLAEYDRKCEVILHKLCSYQLN